ncbi:MAG: OB-fold nucleic acid binding domain-containing protein, partial [Patescibacteria group bacterium]
MASLEELRQIRLAKLNALSNTGNYPYPARVKKDYPNSYVHEYFDSLTTATESIFLAGRVKAIRLHGQAAFLDIEDDTGEVQIFLQKDRLGEEKFNLVEANIDLGDFIEAGGRLFKTKQEAKTLEVDSFRIVVKALRPLPEEWFGLKDIEERLRHRYLDLILNKGVKEVFRRRSQLIADIRKFLAKEGFI